MSEDMVPISLCKINTKERRHLERARQPIFYAWFDLLLNDSEARPRGSETLPHPHPPAGGDILLTSCCQGSQRPHGTVTSLCAERGLALGNALRRSRNGQSSPRQGGVTHTKLIHSSQALLRSSRPGCSQVMSPRRTTLSQAC